jgi:hypothetical protein
VTNNVASSALDIHKSRCAGSCLCERAPPRMRFPEQDTEGPRMPVEAGKACVCFCRRPWRKCKSFRLQFRFKATILTEDHQPTSCSRQERVSARPTTPAPR